MKLEIGQKIQAKMFGSYIDAVVIGEPMVLVRFPGGLSQSVRLDHVKVDEPRVACGDYTEDKDVPGYCEGCTLPKGEHSAESIAGPSSSNLYDIKR